MLCVERREGELPKGVNRWKYRRLLAAALLPILCLVTFYCWYFSTSEHATAVSPDAQWTAIITKRQQRFGEPVEIRLQIVENGGSQRVWLDTAVDHPDLWEDAKRDSYLPQWQNAEEFLLSGRREEDGFILHGRYRGDRWVHDPTEAARQ